MRQARSARVQHQAGIETLSSELDKADKALSDSKLTRADNDVSITIVLSADFHISEILSIGTMNHRHWNRMRASFTKGILNV